MNAGEIISWTLDNMPLRNEPGTNYAYSNFGYCILGRVIEKISGLRYEDYVKKFILDKAGISDMEIGGNTLADRKPNEVVYYGQGGEDPYVFNIKRMDSHGGWIASATDLVRFILCVDSFSTKPDILSASTIKTMTEPSSSNKNYACGWQVNEAHNWWHSGSLPGTATEMVRAHNGYSWAVLTNTRTWQQGFVQDLDHLVWQVLKDSTIQWQPKEKL
jgi:CubicO group peptidase (beta-lactamase class C family)